MIPAALFLSGLLGFVMGGDFAHGLGAQAVIMLAVIATELVKIADRIQKQ